MLFLLIDITGINIQPRQQYTSYDSDSDTDGGMYTKMFTLQLLTVLQWQKTVMMLISVTRILMK